MMNSDSDSKSTHNQRIDDLTSTLTMISRLSIFNSVQASEYDEGDYDDTDDEDEEDETEKTCIGTELSKNIENDENEDENNEDKDTLDYDLEGERENFDSASEDDQEYYNNDINEYYKRHANQFDEDPSFQNDPLMDLQLNSLSLKPLNVQTNHSYLLNNQVSPRAQLYEITNELDKSKKENNELLKMYNSLKAEEEKSQEKINLLMKENERIKKELSSSNELVKELKLLNVTNKSSEQLEKLRSENQRFSMMLTEERVRVTDLENQVKKLKKYEYMFKKIDLLKINDKIYQLTRRIGKGGFSEVYHCISSDDYKSYALKKCDLTNMDEENTKLVLNEIDLLKKLQVTDKVVKLFEHQYLPEKRLLFVLMEMGSCDLSHIFKKEISKYNAVREPGRVMYWKKMLEAVKAIHDLGVIHSDLKPANFLLVNDEVKLIDFNISMGMGERTSITVQNECGTMEYMSPDIFLKDEKTGRLNQKVDIWALGVILYLMTYGVLPLQHIKNQVKKLHSITDPLMKEFKFGPIENKNLLDTLHNCLRHDPSERFTVDQLLTDAYVSRFK